ncbi:MAG: hypothetical protein Q4E64_08675 [Phascolarctobacterium sp.]|uniref:hypothetical protein n=1 Tax=Phascolarctobacterium sp. TaxID=2049039 RepID=UPI0026DBCADC|nr:hypothetical protein [Phascolarctobacterium sp.]MDO4921879.1 hypothetical protein [Phascolarctobacterium sp.]
MTWGSFIVKTLGMLILLWLVLFFAYGNMFLVDTIVPVEGIDVDEWISSYKICGGISGLSGFICAAIWFFIGNGYAGEGGISIKFYALLILSIVLGLLCNFIFLPGAVDGSGLASVFVVVFPPVLYYLAGLFAYAPAVKYIPAGADTLHK